MKRLLFVYIVLATSLYAVGQAPRSAYHTEGFVYGHVLNPALQPDTSYLAMPLYGNFSVSMNSTLPMKTLFYNMPGNLDKLTLFTTKGTISKADLLDKVGNGMKANVDARMTLFSMGKRLSDKRYRTLDVAFRTQASTYVPRDFFAMVKDVENGTYSIDGLNLDVSSFFDVSYGESYRLNDYFTVGAKVKLLAGIANANVQARKLNVDVRSEGNWTVEGDIQANVTGFEYKTTTKEYSSRKAYDQTPMTYQMVNGAKIGGLGLNGLGVAIDAGVEYNSGYYWTMSASVRDLGFVTWFNTKRANNSGNKFEFKGFENISTEKDSPNSLSNQFNSLKDDFMDMTHLEENGKETYVKALNCVMDASVMYRRSIFTAGLLSTFGFQGKKMWVESRLNLGVNPYPGIDVVISPAYGTYGYGLGAMLSYHKKGYNIFLASDRLFYEVNRQYIPTSLNADLQMGVTFPL